jgi:hypothetical protein
MGATRTLLQLRTGARKYADFIASGSAASVFSDATVDEFVNDAIAEYYEMLVSVRGHEYFMATTPLAITSGTASYALPDTFMALSTLTLEWNATQHELVEPIDSQLHRHLFNNLQTWTQYSRKGFRIYGAQDGTQTLEFSPTPGSSVTGRLRYIPTFAPLVGDAAVIFIVNGFDKLVETTAAIEMRTVKGLPIAALQTLQAAQLERLQEMAAERLADQPARVVDVDPDRQRGDDWAGPRRFLV